MSDLLVVGGGPAGCAAAVRARSAGLSVTLLAAPARRPALIESLPPAGRRLLTDLGCWDAFQQLQPDASRGVRSVWGAPQPVERDSIRDPDGPGWHVERAAFDAMLLRHAAASGASVRPSRLRWLHRDGSGFRAGDGTGSELAARFVIDATGRAASVATRLGAHRRYHDRSVATVCSWLPGPADHDQRTFIEAAPNGWWYSIRAGRHARTVGRISDHGTGPASPPPGIRQLLDGARELAGCRRIAANSGQLEPFAGPGWAAAGDAALSFDPLSSQGIMSALFTGRAAADCASGWLAGRPGALAEHADRLAAIGRTYRSNLLLNYRSEQRWPDQPFWSSRQASRPEPVRAR